MSKSSVDLIVGDINILDLASWWIMEGDLKNLKKSEIFSFFFPIFKVYLHIFARVFGEFGWDTELLGVGLPDFISKELGLEMEVFGVGLPDLISNETERLLMWLWGVVWWLLGWLIGFFGVAEIEIWKRQSFFKEKYFKKLIYLSLMFGLYWIMKCDPTESQLYTRTYHMIISLCMNCRTGRCKVNKLIMCTTIIPNIPNASRYERNSGKKWKPIYSLLTLYVINEGWCSMKHD